MLFASPAEAHEALQLDRLVSRVELPDGPAREGCCRLVFISDTHDLHRQMAEIPDGDVLIHTGDFTNNGSEACVADFLAWMASQAHAEKVLIAGNHDMTLDPTFYARKGWRFHRETQDVEKVAAMVRASGITYLENSATRIAGGRLKVWGSPCTLGLPFGSAFPIYPGRSKRSSKALWDSIPDDTDIVLTHGPPLGIGDGTVHGDRAGCIDLLGAMVERVQPRIHAFGHIHESHGCYRYEGCETTFINGATCTVRHRPTHPPIVIDLPLG